MFDLFSRWLSPVGFLLLLFICGVVRLAMGMPVGFRPSHAELLALKKASEELEVPRSDLIRTAVREWLGNRFKEGMVSIVPPDRPVKRRELA